LERLTGHEKLAVGMDVNEKLNSLACCEIVDVAKEAFVLRCIAGCLTYGKTSESVDISSWLEDLPLNVSSQGFVEAPPVPLHLI